jgi:uracil-DNA glycosylase
LVEELRLLSDVRVVIALGHIGFEAFLKAWADAGRPLPPVRPRFLHAAEAELPGRVTLLASYHPSQRNTQTGLLTSAMLSRVLGRAKRVIADTAEPH